MPATEKDAQERVASYITDMLALEVHIEQAISGQIKDLDDEPAVVMELRTIHAMCESHIAALEAMAEQRKVGGQGVAEVIKKAASSLLGMGAAGVDMLRAEKLPKNLRDDYTALNLACIGYVMLHTAAAALGDEPVAQLAQRHLEGHSRCVMTVHNMVPAAVMSFLKDEGHAVRTDRLAEILQVTERVWQSARGAGQLDHMPV